MSEVRVTELDCAEVDELAGLYVLHALAADEEAAVRDHLATCSEPHELYAELGGVVPHLSLLLEPEDAPPDLKARVMSAIAAEPRMSERPVAATAPTDISATRQAPVDLAPYRERRQGAPAWRSWAFAAAAGLIIAVLGAWNVTLQSRADDTAARLAAVREAVALRDAPGARVASLAPTDGATSMTGFAAFPPDGEGYLVVTGLAPAPAGRTYQAWFMVDGAPTSAGVFDSGPDGLAVLARLRPVSGTDGIALSVEPAGGLLQPSTSPFMFGELGS